MGINLSSLLTEEDLFFCKRISELYEKAENSTPAFSQFLNARQRYIVENRFPHLFSDDESSPLSFFWGGFPGAERVLLCLLPAYMRYELSEGDCPEKLVAESIVPLRIKGGGYVKLSHRDYLGAIVSLGVDRMAIGDIITYDDGAVVFTLPSVSELIKTELSHIGRDKVKIDYASLPAGFNYVREYEKLHSTVASPRLDAVISELARTSRENAKALISSGLVEHNHFTADKPAATVANGDIISVRRAAGTKGGKFIIDSIDEKSSKGRIHLAARKYV